MKYIIYTFAVLIQTNLIGQAIETNQISIGEKISIYSNVLEEDREIFIYEPKGFWGMDEEMKNLPVVYVLDGESQFLNTVATIDYLSSAPEGNDVLPRCIIVGIPNTNRNRDLTPRKAMLGNDPSTLEVTGGGPDFLEFITSELIPYIDENYATCNHRTIIGHSLGGIFALDVLLNKREYFNNYLAIDPALGFDNNTYVEEVLDTLRNSDLSDENLFFAAGNNRQSFMSLVDLKNDTFSFSKLVDIPNQEFLNLKESKDWSINLSMKYYEDENHFSVPHRATYDAMRYFYSFYHFKKMMDYYHPHYSNKKDLVLLLKNHFAKISEKMGCEFIPMEGYINSFAFGFSHYKRHDLAIDLFNYNIALYPDRSTVYSNFGFYHKNNHNRKEAIAQFDKSLKLKADENILEIRNQVYKEMIELGNE